MRFPMAATEGWLSALIIPLLALPGAMFVLAAWIPSQTDLLGAFGSVLVVSYATVWLFLLPTGLEVTPTNLIIDFPLRSIEIPLASITGAEWFEGSRFTQTRSGRLRIRLGALWGGIRWPRTPQTSYEQYTSRSTDLVLVHRSGERPLLLSPADPEGFTRVLAAGHALPLRAAGR